jgi:hypothetical protein
MHRLSGPEVCYAFLELSGVLLFVRGTGVREMAHDTLLDAPKIVPRRPQFVNL